MINLSYLLLIIYEMKYGLLSMGIFTTLQTIAFIYYICQKPPKPLPETLKDNLPDNLPDKKSKLNMLILLQKYK